MGLIKWDNNKKMFKVVFILSAYNLQDCFGLLLKLLPSKSNPFQRATTLENSLYNFTLTILLPYRSMQIDKKQLLKYYQIPTQFTTIDFCWFRWLYHMVKNKCWLYKVVNYNISINILASTVSCPTFEGTIFQIMQVRLHCFY